MTTKRPVIKNPSALRDYHLEKSFEAGLQLQGNEVKSLRGANANLKGSFAKILNGELLLYNMHISPYEFSRDDYDPLRPRKLLLHKKEIRQLTTGLNQKGFAIIPVKVYFKRGYAKIEVALATGKKLYDKRKTLKEKQIKRETEQAIRRRR